ncbi:hypothetical protein PGT21_006644 [Puccinia graminis f. sp. tritici]|uniref:Uncharacterized protein n=1 Tax=Puccinia graminis f. sp. tritici TaxID=56615 RepID=A0A5B0NBD0_PUCGR|nr:hypothetical protein PGT21_006644 [Puccinia graminis f. sp. tritici]KAA1118384.1 hypothetical protein PGTUg99_006190 [Puccinia graminis f. sp. tritici]
MSTENGSSFLLLRDHDRRCLPAAHAKLDSVCTSDQLALHPSGERGSDDNMEAIKRGPFDNRLPAQPAHSSHSLTHSQSLPQSHSF